MATVALVHCSAMRSENRFYFLAARYATTSHGLSPSYRALLQGVNPPGEEDVSVFFLTRQRVPQFQLGLLRNLT
jgi:hypothetical protein